MFYYNDYNKYVKQYDFYFTDGSQGSIFVVAKISALISKPLLIDMFIAILFILIFILLAAGGGAAAYVYYVLPQKQGGKFMTK